VLALRTVTYCTENEETPLTKVNGPAMEMLGLRVEPLQGDGTPQPDSGWDEDERRALRQRIDARQPFLDLLFHRTEPDGRRRQFRVSGQPMFDQACRFVGYRGIGVEVTAGM
ncbi:MAG: response regulator, partial [Methylibium petroleiphilum]